ncbi:MAG: DUF502 domain-containing protein [Pseudomonadota bacterium]
MRRYLIAGLLIWLPLTVTVLVIKVLVDLMDRSLLLLPPAWRPDALLGFSIPGLGVVLTFAVLLVTGILVANFFGRRLLGAWESLLARIPLIRSVYSGAKQVAETFFADSGQAFKKVMLVEYPRKGVWSLAFQTSSDLREIQARTPKEVVCVFVPTTPNPTSGFIIMAPSDELIELDMSVDDALKMVISLGVLVPPLAAPPQSP